MRLIGEIANRRFEEYAIKIHKSAYCDGVHCFYPDSVFKVYRYETIKCIIFSPRIFINHMVLYCKYYLINFFNEWLSKKKKNSIPQAVMQKWNILKCRMNSAKSGFSVW